VPVEVTPPLAGVAGVAATTGPTAPGAATPGAATPGTATPGTATPGTVTPRTVTPGAATADTAQGGISSTSLPPAATKPPAAVQANVASAPVKPVRATVHFTIAPWGRVFIDGRSAGVSPPLKHLKLAPGTHMVEIRNEASTPYRQTVTLSSGASLNIRHQFN
jgi:hypothetical protein